MWEGGEATRKGASGPSAFWPLAILNFVYVVTCFPPARPGFPRGSGGGGFGSRSPSAFAIFASGAVPRTFMFPRRCGASSTTRRAGAFLSGTLTRQKATFFWTPALVASSSVLQFCLTRLAGLLRRATLLASPTLPMSPFRLTGRWVRACLRTARSTLLRPLLLSARRLLSCLRRLFRRPRCLRFRILHLPGLYRRLLVLLLLLLLHWLLFTR